MLTRELRELRLPSVLEHWRTAAEDAAEKGESHAEYLADLVHREINDRHDRRVQRRIQEAKFPTLKT